ncbi:MAG: glycosyltransferase family 4 protein [Anaerolineae bacterium]
MRIAMIGPFGLRPKGTMSVRALPMAKALVARGHQVTLIMPPWSWPEDSGREWEEDGVEVVNIPLPPPIPLLQHLVITARLVRRAWRGRPDVVHCFKPKAYAGLAAMALWFLGKLGLAKVRLVVDSDDWEGAGGWNEIENYTWLQKRLFAFQERWGLTHCQALTVASKALETIVWSLGVPRDRVFYVPNGLGLVAADQGSQGNHPGPRALPSSSDLTTQGGQRVRAQFGLVDRPVILLYTRFFEFRVERVIEFLADVLDKLPTARLLVVGQGLFGEGRQLTALAAERGLADKVICAGWVEPRQLPHYFAAADVAIYPYDDTLINRTKCAVKLIDLMAAGLPIVAEEVGQNGQYIEHGCSGLLIEPGHTAALAGAVLGLLQDREQREALSRAARRRVLEEFSWDRLVETVERAYGGIT